MKKRPAAPSILMDNLDFFYSGSAAPNHLLPDRLCATEGSTFGLGEIWIRAVDPARSLPKADPSVGAKLHRDGWSVRRLPQENKLNTGLLGPDSSFGAVVVQAPGMTGSSSARRDVHRW
jgi:hypothetical protein